MGLLTGKYREGVPADSRGAVKGMGFLVKTLTDPDKNAVVANLQAVASDLDCSLAQLAVTWTLKNPRVSSVIMGASRVAQLQENLRALDVVARPTPEVMARIDAICTAGNKEITWNTSTSATK